MSTNQERKAIPIMSNLDQAKRLLETFATGDIDTAADLLDPGYIQHNLSYATGRDAFIDAVKQLAAAPEPTTVEIVRAFEDGYFVFLHSIYNFAGSGKQVAFDVFRFNDAGKIVEHWDNLAELAAPNPSGHTQTDGPVDALDHDATEANRELVKHFLVDVMQGKAPEKTATYFDGDAYIQHNSQIADGLSGLGAALEALAEAGIHMVYDQTHLVLAQGNMVLALSEGSFGGAATAFYDLWRVENGKIAEHWDVMQSIPAEDSWANRNGKF